MHCLGHLKIGYRLRHVRPQPTSHGSHPLQNPPVPLSKVAVGQSVQDVVVARTEVSEERYEQMQRWVGLVIPIN